MKPPTTSRGSATPFGATVLSRDDGLCVNFAIHARVRPTLHLFRLSKSNKPLRDAHHVIPMPYCTGDVFHVQVDMPGPNVGYCYEVPGRGFSLDPWARWVVDGTNVGVGRLGVVDGSPGGRKFEWGEEGLERRSKERKGGWGEDVAHTVLYECHVGMMGGLVGMRKKINYLKKLGVTAVEIMPIMEFSERGGGVWGYCPVNFFAVMRKYASDGDGTTAALEFKELVRELHKHDIEVYLDVVYNHTVNYGSIWAHLETAEDYYMGKVDKRGRFHHYDYSLCGNTMSPNSPMMMNLILHSLRWWVTEYHVDGFRVDAAGIFCRDPDGSPTKTPAVIQAIGEDAVLKSCKLIVEPWDGGDARGSPNFLIGKFPYGHRWMEWNPVWRDSVRKFIRGDPGSVSAFRKALRGCRGLFDERPYGSCHSVNYVCCHDGFCLYDLVSFTKRTQDDGYEEGTSFNCGYEGVIKDSATTNSQKSPMKKSNLERVRLLRNRQMRNFMLALFFSRGTPMITMGDEIGQTKYGNNNTWNVRNLPSPFPTSTADEAAHNNLLQFVRKAISFRRASSLLGHADFWGNCAQTPRTFQWVDAAGKEVHLKDETLAAESLKDAHLTDATKKEENLSKKSPQQVHLTSSKVTETLSNLVCFVSQDRRSGEALYVAFNSQRVPQKISLPRGHQWRLLVNTSSQSPDDWQEDCQTFVPLTDYEIPSFTAIVMIA